MLLLFANILHCSQANVVKSNLHARSQKENCNRFPEKSGMSGRKMKVLNLAVRKESTCTYIWSLTIFFSISLCGICIVYFLSCMSTLCYISLRLLPRVCKMHTNNITGSNIQNFGTHADETTFSSRTCRPIFYFNDSISRLLCSPNRQLC